MLTASSIDHLFHPLIARARGNQHPSLRGFRDLAAELVVKKLGLEQQYQGDSSNSNEEIAGLVRSQWLDQQLLSLLERFPKAWGIELGSGISTRFQRLSLQLDWPQFSWTDIDHEEVVEYARLVLPATDNYQMFARQAWTQDWWRLGPHLQSRELIYVLEGKVSHPCEPRLVELLVQLNRQAQQHQQKLVVMFDYPNSSGSSCTEDWQALKAKLTAANVPYSPGQDTENADVISLKPERAQTDAEQPPKLLAQHCFPTQSSFIERSLRWLISAKTQPRHWCAMVMMFDHSKKNNNERTSK